MAKVSCNYSVKSQNMRIEEISKPIVFVVDMINGFIKEGALSDIQIMDVVPSIKELLSQGFPSVFVCDAHDLDASEFSSYPMHCIKNTYESKVIDELSMHAKRIFLKNSTNAFFADGMEAFLQNEFMNYDDIIIVGCCSDICILQFALTLQAFINQNEYKNKRVIVPINMIETYHIEGVHNNMKYNEMACDFMIANAISVVEMK